MNQTSPASTVLGIDPGTRVMGYGVLDASRRGPRLVDCGVFSAPARAGVAERLARLQAQLVELLDRLRPGTLAIETAFSARNVKSALRIGEARGMVLAAAAGRGIEVVEIAPSVAKKAVIGHGAGSKEQVASMVRTILGQPDLDVPADATDALAIALAHLNQEKLRALVRRGSA